MKHIKTLTTRDLKESMKKGGCGECQTSCQSACKTSCTVGNQSCEETNVSSDSGRCLFSVNYSELEMTAYSLSDACIRKKIRPAKYGEVTT